MCRNVRPSPDGHRISTTEASEWLDLLQVFYLIESEKHKYKNLKEIDFYASTMEFMLLSVSYDLYFCLPVLRIIQNQIVFIKLWQITGKSRSNLSTGSY